MLSFRNTLRILLAACPLHGVLAEPVHVVFQNGRSIPASHLSLAGDKLVVKTEAEGFKVGQSFPLTMADHVYGEKPAEINQAIALTLSGRAEEALTLLLPVVKEHAITAKIPGNFWLEAARSLLVAHAINGDDSDTTSIGKEISDATPAQGIDPFVMLGKALLMSTMSTKPEERELALKDLTIGNKPADLCAYASFFRGNLLKKNKKNAEALEAYLSVPCLYPSGGLIFNAAAELQASDLLAGLKRREEAVALIQSALLACKGTVLEEEANNRLTSLK